MSEAQTGLNVLPLRVSSLRLPQWPIALGEILQCRVAGEDAETQAVAAAFARLQSLHGETMPISSRAE